MSGQNPDSDPSSTSDGRHHVLVSAKATDEQFLVPGLYQISASSTCQGKEGLCNTHATFQSELDEKLAGWKRQSQKTDRDAALLASFVSKSCNQISEKDDRNWTWQGDEGDKGKGPDDGWTDLTSLLVSGATELPADTGTTED